MIERLRRRLTYANVMATLALFVALGGGAYAVATIGPGDIEENAVRSRHIKRANVERSDLGPNAVNSGRVKDFGLRLHDLGGKTNDAKATVDSTINVPAGECRGALLRGFGPPKPKRVIGSLVVGFLTDDEGNAVLDNAGVVLPTMVSETSQGGAIANLAVCGFGTNVTGSQTVPAGSVFHYHVIGP